MKRDKLLPPFLVGLSLLTVFHISLVEFLCSNLVVRGILDFLPESVIPWFLQDGEGPPELASFHDPTTVVVNYSHYLGITYVAADYYGGNICNRLRQEQTMDEYSSHSTLVNVSFECHHLFVNSGFGTGNFISAFYALRMVAQVLGNTDVVMLCQDAIKHRRDLILPWLTGVFPQQSRNATTEQQPRGPSIAEVCKNYTSCPIGYQWKDMAFELRRMAIAMVGIPSPEHPSSRWAQEHLWPLSSQLHYRGPNYYQLPHPRQKDPPLYPGTEIDDAVLHFRCGDIISSQHPFYGFMKFTSYSRYISASARTIAIVTQPFSTTAQTRILEGGQQNIERCKKVVYAFVDHLREQFPYARVSIRNAEDETIALTFARMIMANQTIIGLSSFGIFPGITTFGTGYILNTSVPLSVTLWLPDFLRQSKIKNARLINEPLLLSSTLGEMWGSDGSAVIDWFHDKST